MRINQLSDRNLSFDSFNAMVALSELFQQRLACNSIQNGTIRRWGNNFHWSISRLLANENIAISQFLNIVINEPQDRIKAFTLRLAHRRAQRAIKRGNHEIRVRSRPILVNFPLRLNLQMPLSLRSRRQKNIKLRRKRRFNAQCWVHREVLESHVDVLLARGWDPLVLDF